MTSCQALYDKVKKLDGSVGDIQDFCGKSIRSIEKILMHIDFSEKHGLKESDVPHTPLRPLIDMETKNPKAVEKAVMHIKTLLESGKKVTGGMIDRVVREAKGLSIPDKAPRVSIDLDPMLLQQFTMVNAENKLGFKSFTAFATKAIEDALMVFLQTK